ncbi:DUF1499 domain-containing protein [uncultured Psychrosphaera sp.]|uniref:DUF1499 domain-containing protein n=1 Tax=uncultured Psychrosphaera sp. TaxID=1403522 RepID=UPI002632742F|nr:DUF1499 domain-containing protein [uncultured Psychrosphaera sp.]
MKKILIAVVSLIVIVVVMFLVLGQMSKTGGALGLQDGKLAKCSSKPNCASSEYIEDVEHFVAGLDIAMPHSIPKIESVITEMGGVIVNKNDDYVSATFTSATFGFVDDFEVRVDVEQKRLHFRSASRVGYSDRGVNKKRVELFKSLYK